MVDLPHEKGSLVGYDDHDDPRETGEVPVERPYPVRPLLAGEDHDARLATSSLLRIDDLVGDAGDRPQRPVEHVVEESERPLI
jgi:hypothetical protein